MAYAQPMIINMWPFEITHVCMPHNIISVLFIFRNGMFAVAFLIIASTITLVFYPRKTLDEELQQKSTQVSKFCKLCTGCPKNTPV